MSVNYKQCPRCGSKNTVKIIYGYPSPELLFAAEEGEFKLGGCCIVMGHPEYFCNDCEHEWNREEATNNAYSKIKIIKASVGGCFDGSYNVVIDLENLKTSWNFYSGFIEETNHKFIRSKTAQRLIEQLKMVNLLNWKSKYIDSAVLDGTHWSVEIITDKRTIRKYGDNQYPDGWGLFCRVIAQITGGKFR